MPGASGSRPELAPTHVIFHLQHPPTKPIIPELVLALKKHQFNRSVLDTKNDTVAHAISGDVHLAILHSMSAPTQVVVSMLPVQGTKDKTLMKRELAGAHQKLAELKALN